MKGQKPIAILTAYNFPVARALEQAAIPAILVGDSVGMVEMGFDSTRSVTMEQMIYHLGAVRRGAPDTHVIGDLPYGSDRDPQSALKNARRLVAAGADSIKLEGAKPEAIRQLVRNDIAVVGHTGLTPQSATSFRKVGRSDQEAEQLLQDARAIQEAGAFMLVLEHIPSELGAAITEKLTIPTIGIGAGPDCDGQILVVNDALGLGERWPPFSKQYAQLGHLLQQVAADFIEEVTSRRFPGNIISRKGKSPPSEPGRAG